jgi:hypothetical protein
MCNYNTDLVLSLAYIALKAAHRKDYFCAVT